MAKNDRFPPPHRRRQTESLLVRMTPDTRRLIREGIAAHADRTGKRPLPAAALLRQLAVGWSLDMLAARRQGRLS